jgi:DNA-binding MarR family transcriptional regulator
MTTMAKSLRKSADAAPREPAGRRRAGETPPLDRVIHEPVRLGIVSALAAHSPLSFLELKNLLQATDGNISVHARKLEEAGYLRCHKSFAGRLPRTEYQLTPAGRRAFARYLDHMEALVQKYRAQ